MKTTTTDRDEIEKLIFHHDMSFEMYRCVREGHDKIRAWKKIAGYKIVMYVAFNDDASMKYARFNMNDIRFAETYRVSATVIETDQIMKSRIHADLVVMIKKFIAMNITPQELNYVINPDFSNLLYHMNNAKLQFADLKLYENYTEVIRNRAETYALEDYIWEKTTNNSIEKANETE